MSGDPQVIPMPVSRNRRQSEPWNMSAQDVADYFGCHVETVYRMGPEEIPFTYFKGRRRYRLSDVERYAQENRA